MARLSKKESKAHQQACELLKKNWLTCDDREFILDHWNEGATNLNTVAGAFFTPRELASDFSIEVAGSKVIDLCAGIGALSYAVAQKHVWGSLPCDLTCIEINPDYIEVGKKLLPDATWIRASIFDVLDMGLGRFDVAISNPPFGRINRDGGTSPVYTGSEFEFHVIDIASQIAAYGVFLLPQESAGFKYSGNQCFERQTSGKAIRFQEQTGLRLEPGCGIDTSVYLDQWRGVSPLCEVVCVEFDKQEPVQQATDAEQFDLFSGEAA